MSKRYLQWGYDSFKDTKTGEISDNHIHLLNQQAERISELEEQLANSIRPKFKPNNDLFVIVGYKDETQSIEQYYIDEIVIRGNGKLIEYRDIEQETIIGENNLLFGTYEEALKKLEELRGK